MFIVMDFRSDRDILDILWDRRRLRFLFKEVASDALAPAVETEAVPASRAEVCLVNTLPTVL